MQFSINLISVLQKHYRLLKKTPTKQKKKQKNKPKHNNNNKKTQQKPQNLKLFERPRIYGEEGKG